MASAEPTRIERRCGHRFTQFQVPAFLRSADGKTGTGFTLDLSSRGALLLTDFEVVPEQFVEITLVMPSEITLGEDMSVRCHAQVLRLQPAREGSTTAVAVRFDHYDFVPRELAPLQQHVSPDRHVPRP